MWLLIGRGKLGNKYRWVMPAHKDKFSACIASLVHMAFYSKKKKDHLVARFTNNNAYPHKWKSWWQKYQGDHQILFISVNWIFGIILFIKPYWLTQINAYMSSRSMVVARITQSSNNFWIVYWMKYCQPSSGWWLSSWEIDDHITLKKTKKWKQIK